MNDDELQRRLADYGATLDRAAAETDATRGTVALDEVATRRRRSVVRAGATVVATAAAAVGLLVLATRDDPGTSTSDEATTTVSASPTTSVLGGTTTTAVGSTSSTPPPSATSSTTDAAGTTTSTVVAEGPPMVPCDLATIVADTGVELAALTGDCHAGWALAITPDCGGGSPEDGGECESADAFHITTDGWRRVGPVYPFCVDPLVQATGMAVATATAFGAEPCDPASSVDPDAVPVTLRPGDASPEVRALQIALVFQGYDLAIDGEYGPATAEAVRGVQAAHGLPVDGIAGPATRAALEV